MYFEATLDNSDSIKIPSRIQPFLEKIKGSKISVKVEKWKQKRSHPQNAYYWAAVVPAAQQLLISWGNDADEVDAHETLKSEIGKLSKAFVSPQGEVMRIPGSTASLSVGDFAEYVEKCRIWLTENGCNII